MKLSKLFLITSISLGFAMFTSCNAEDSFEELTTEKDVNTVRTCEVKFNVSKTEYDNPNSRSTQSWEEGDKIFLSFKVGTSITTGNAEYKSGKWELSYYGNLTADTESECVATFIENADNVVNDFVSFTEKSAIYEDLNGKYMFNDTLLSVTANLTPKVGRLRFAGNEGDSAIVHGVSYYTSYDAVSRKYIKSSAPIKAKVGSDKYTQYIYGEFTDTISPNLNIITTRTGYSKQFPSTIYKSGESGYIDFPTTEAHNGWCNYLTFNVNGAKMNMLPVEQVTTEETLAGEIKQYSVFFLAETETTRALYSAVTGTAITTNLQVPYSGISYSSWKSFVSQLKSLTEVPFRVPTQQEWQYAAKGGIYSQGYIYAGSNNIDDVAWYSGNSDNEVHSVKLKARNELGFYDMSGNLAEYTTYSSSVYFCGGSFNDSASYCYVTSYVTSTSSSYYSYFGLRVALSF